MRESLPPSVRRWLLAAALLSLVSAGTHAAPPEGVPITFQLPADGPLPRTDRVTLAIVDAQNPDWIVSQFACGLPCTVTAENGGRFTKMWNGLDDNFMPVPPGTYAVKGIVMPAQRWPIDQEWHTITPRFHSGASSWLPAVEDWQKPEPFGGDPVGAPLADVAVGANGIAVFYYSYLENGRNNPMFDLKKPNGYEQFVRAFPSGGAGGGTSVATDGETVWAFSTDGGPKFVYRADGKPFGRAEGANRPDSFSPEGWVTALAVARDAATGKAFLYVAQRGKIVNPKKHEFEESATEPIDKITVHDGATGAVLATAPLARPRGLAVLDDTLYALHADGSGFAVSAAPLRAGLPGAWQRVFTVPAAIHPADLEVDRHGRFYLSDSEANRVFQLDRSGKVLRTFGRLASQRAGAYDRESFIAPGKLATWTDPDGNDRLIVVEQGGPNRVSEWSADGRFLRDFLTLQTHANDGYAFDPEHPEHVYLPGQQGWLTRFRVDYATRQWTIDAVWPGLESDPRFGVLDRIKLIRAHGQLFLAGRRSRNLYRLEPDRCVLSAAFYPAPQSAGKAAQFISWHDANGNGRTDDDEFSTASAPPGVFSYHGQNWLEDLSYLAVAQGTQDVWRLAPSGFDKHGNPIFQDWQKVLTDPVFAARTAGQADAVHGGNELAENFSSDWSGADGAPADGFYVQARGGTNFSANEGPQHKITRYIPDPAGGFKLKWRTGRSVLGGTAQPGEMSGAMRVQRPINGLVSVIDQSRCGVLLYTESGLYVDTIFPDGRRFTPKTAGLYAQPGEFFAGEVFPNAANGKIYFAMGKDTPLLFEAEGWSLRENAVRALTTLSPSVTITAAQISAPPEIALTLRGGAGAARIARFAPALGTVAFDGSLSGWEQCEPIAFQADKEHAVEVRCLYRPESLLLRWHARLGTLFEPKTLPAPERIFTHDQLADTLSFYFQGNADAAPNGPLAGRPGDVRFVFGIFRDAAKGAPQPVAVGLYPTWSGPGPAHPQTYRTPVGEAAFAHVGPVAGARLAQTIDADGKGFVFLAELPRSALPGLAQPIDGTLRRLANFEATFGGHNKFWWANRDGSASRETYDEPTEARLYPGSWAPALFQGLEAGVTARNWMLCGPFGGPGVEQFREDPNGRIAGSDRNMKEAVRAYFEAAKFPPESGLRDYGTVFSGSQVQGYWPDPGQVRWHSATVADLDNRVIAGKGAQVWFGATWIHADEAMELEFQFQSHPQTELRWSLNDQPIPAAELVIDNRADNHPIARKKLSLRAGWNVVSFRGYCVGYPPFRAGLVLNGPPEKLWQIQLSGTPPTAVR